MMNENIVTTSTSDQNNANRSLDSNDNNINNNNNNHEINGNNNNNMTLSERLYYVINNEIESYPVKALNELKFIQEQVAYLSLLSSKNECYINEMNTKSLLYIMVEHYLAMSYINISTDSRNNSNGIIQRQQNLQMSCHLWIEFIHRINQLEDDHNNNEMSITLSIDEKQLYNELIEMTENQIQQSQQSNQQSSSIMMPSMNNSRDMKIARHQRKKDIENELLKLHSYLDRRKRLDISMNDEMDGYDEDGLERNIIIKMIQICKVNCFDEWMNVLRELPMITIMIQKQQQSGTTTLQDDDPRQQNQQNQNQQHNKSMELTHITQNPFTGQLNIKKEEIKNNVFRPSWNLPTMSLEELAHIEVTAAMERDERHKVSEEVSKTQPKRYNDLYKDGNEDNHDLVDSSAILDRKWDDWKDENPKGSGNKRGDVGDRNF